MKVIADINVSPNVVAGLRSLGHDVQRVDAFLPATAADVEVAEVAARLGGAVLTRDLDFSAILAMSQAKAPSLINLRTSRTDAPSTVALVHLILSRHADDLAQGCIITADDGVIRVHRLPVGSAH